MRDGLHDLYLKIPASAKSKQSHPCSSNGPALVLRLTE